MRVPHSKKILFCVLLFCAAVLKAAAQGKGPGGGGAPGGGSPPGAHGPGGFGVPGGFGGMSGRGPGVHSGVANRDTSSRTGLQAAPEGRWWDDRSTAETIGLRSDQQKKMDEIFKANKPAIVGSYRSFLSEKSKLDTLNKQSSVDQARVFAAIDAVSQARASLEKANTQMLLQIRQQLDPEQIQRLERLPQGELK